MHFIPLPWIGKSQNEILNAVNILIGLGMRNYSGKISVLLKWKVFFNVSLELEMGKLSRHETGFIKVEVLPSPGPRGASRKLVIKSEATVLFQLLCVLH